MKASPETYALAAVGLAGGAFRYYIRPELTAKRTWALIGAMVVAHEIISPPGELLSEGCDTALETHPYLTRIIIGVTALHLANALPEKFDPIHRGLKLLKG